jgi:peptidoglycan hydrolase-like protein with peptidoglycan-binding domain
MLRIIKSLIITTIVASLAISNSWAYTTITGDTSDRNVNSGIDKKRECVLFASNLKLRDGALNKNEVKVRELQDFLIKEGYLTSSSTGTFGEQTKKALSNYQLAKGITPSGNLGDLTRDVIRKSVCENIKNSDFKIKPVSSSSPTSSKPIVMHASSTGLIITSATGTGAVCNTESHPCSEWLQGKRVADCDEVSNEYCNNFVDLEALKAQKNEERMARENRNKLLDKQIKRDLEKDKKFRSESFKPQIFKTQNAPEESINLVKSAFFDFISK